VNHRQIQAAPVGRIRMNASLLDRRAFMATGNLLLASLRARRRRLTMVLLEADELRDIEVQHGTAVALAMRHAFADRLLAVAGHLGGAAQTGEYEYTLLLPLVDEELGWRMIERELGDPAVVRVPLASRSDQPPQATHIRPTCMLRTIGPDQRSLQAWHAELRGELAELKWHATDPGFSVAPAAQAQALEALPLPARPSRFDLPDWQWPLDLLPPTIPLPLGYV
jgi:hypothetical protein